MGLFTWSLAGDEIATLRDSLVSALSPVKPLLFWMNHLLVAPCLPLDELGGAPASWSTLPVSGPGRSGRTRVVSIRCSGPPSVKTSSPSSGSCRSGPIGWITSGNSWRCSAVRVQWHCLPIPAGPPAGDARDRQHLLNTPKEHFLVWLVDLVPHGFPSGAASTGRPARDTVSSQRVATIRDPALRPKKIDHSVN